ncbi:DUF2158 domain-containing protein [Vibrio alginolyticus]|nr:DUF2158 domain-containing protein [Vibrio alginolyticus]EID0034604.1 DUF2158 domain-containing protein [Vibrio alginolyticus]ELA6589336.1 DUF2158 domain-containing protein [Vibrio alginolyticus]HCG5283738.1 DUF2158 domain-containing protein [Vibrio parahaemolyticus]
MKQIKGKVMSFNEGDVVKLKSGGPDMTIVEIDSEGCFCQWFDDKGQMMSNVFKPVILEKVERNRPMNFRVSRA